MNEEINLNPLFPYLKTRKDANELILLFEDLSGKLFKEDLTAENLFKEKLPYDLSSILQKMSAEENISLLDKTTLQKFLTQIQENITSLPTVHIILALDPTYEMIEEITNWFYDTYKKLVLLDITIDKDLIAGTVLSFNGRANEYSLRNQINQMHTSD